VTQAFYLAPGSVAMGKSASTDFEGVKGLGPYPTAHDIEPLLQIIGEKEAPGPDWDT
jgi:hypothetical protein